MNMFFRKKIKKLEAELEIQRIVSEDLKRNTSDLRKEIKLLRFELENNIKIGHKIKNGIVTDISLDCNPFSSNDVIIEVTNTQTGQANEYYFNEFIELKNKKK